MMTPAELALKTELESSLTHDSRDLSDSVSASDIERDLDAERDETERQELVLLTMTLADRRLAQPALTNFVARAVRRLSTSRRTAGRRPVVTLAEVYAATILSLLDDRTGVPILRSVGTLTNSHIEFFYARGALTLLREHIPSELENQRSVFLWREELIDACRHVDSNER